MTFLKFNEKIILIKFKQFKNKYYKEIFILIQIIIWYTFSNISKNKFFYKKINKNEFFIIN